jgi:2-methylaconitate cis-trans-isomerase PrpF
MLAVLGQARRHLTEAGAGHVLKFALVEPSPGARGSVLDYQFVQGLPDSADSFDLRGSCGHSLLGAAMASPGFGMGPPLGVGRRIRVNVANNGDSVTCEVTGAGAPLATVAGGAGIPGTASFTARFRYAPPRATSRMLLTGEPRTILDVDGTRVPVSLVSNGNPYVFVDGASVGAASAGDLFAGRGRLLERLVRVRQVAAGLLGWPADGAFPKAAAVLPAGPDGGLAVRAVSVPSWHPTLALTGSVCLAAAVNIEGTVPWLAAQASGHTGGPVEVGTPGGRWPISVTIASRNGSPHLAEVTVADRHVTCYGAVRLELPAIEEVA